MGASRRPRDRSLQKSHTDSRWQLVAEGEGGEVAGIGRASRSVPYWLSRRLWRRDLACRFPGCGAKRLVQAHH
ncbi:MAG: hypothetical protein ACYDH5_15000, partial [Acidimicrobiales bacterium]